MKPGFYELVTSRLNVFCARNIVDAWFDKLSGGEPFITAMQFAERVFDKKKHDPKMLITNSAKVLRSNRDGLLPQEGMLDENGDPMFGYGLSAVTDKCDDVRDTEKALPLVNPYQAALAMDAPDSEANRKEDLGPIAPVSTRNITTPLPFGENASRAPLLRVPSRPSASRSSAKGGRHSVHATAIIRKPVVAHKRYLGKSDLPKHLLFKAMNVHAANLQ